MDVRPEQPLIVVGPTPPPTHGVAVATLSLIQGLRSIGLLAAHLDTRDPRTLGNIGQLEYRNVVLGLQHLSRLMRLLHANPGASVYVPIAQGRWALYRDALFVAAARVWRRRVYIHLHGSSLGMVRANADPLLRWVMDWTLRQAHQVWVLTPGLKRVFEGWVDDRRLKVLENVVDDPYQQGSDHGEGDGVGRTGPTRSVPRSNNGPLKVLYLSNLIAEKGPFDLLDAIAALGPDAEGWQVRMVGDTMYPAVRARLQDRARELSRHARVQVPGPAHGDEKLREFDWADVFVMPSRYEGQPLVILEAMAAGLPIVTTDHAGIPETARSEREALLVPPGDSNALAAALRRLATDPQLRAALARSARIRYEDRYRPVRLKEDLTRLLLSDKGKGR